MRKATVAKLSLTAAVGFGALTGFASVADAETPQKKDQTGDIVFVPAPPTTIKPLNGFPVDPQPDPPFDPDFPVVIAQPEDECDFPCDKAPVPQPEPECNPHLLCDQVLTDDGCTWTHGCPEDPEPECPEIVLTCDEITDKTPDPECHLHEVCDEGDGGTDGGTGGGDEGTDDGGDESTTGGDESTTGGTGGTGGGGSLPRTGAEMATWAIAGLGLTGVGAGLRKLSKRTAE